MDRIDIRYDDKIMEYLNDRKLPYFKIAQLVGCSLRTIYNCRLRNGLIGNKEPKLTKKRQKEISWANEVIKQQTPADKMDNQAIKAKKNKDDDLFNYEIYDSLPPGYTMAKPEEYMKYLTI